VFAATKTTLGVVLLWGAARLLPADRVLLAGWIGMCGLAFLLHFGSFHLLSLAWRRAGVDARPLMNWPIRATSLAEFWGQRWNLGFRDLSHTLVFRPLVARCGPNWAMLAVFALSGAVHDLVISLPAGGGFGLPTLYFLLQGLGVLSERSRFGRRLGLGQGWTGRAFAWAVTAGGAFGLFHPPFVREAVVPMMHAMGALA
jgi:alginate O-acetyltransferase complex protein AlgI